MMRGRQHVWFVSCVSGRFSGSQFDCDSGTARKGVSCGNVSAFVVTKRLTIAITVHRLQYTGNKPTSLNRSIVQV